MNNREYFRPARVDRSYIERLITYGNDARILFPLPQLNGNYVLRIINEELRLFAVLTEPELEKLQDIARKKIKSRKKFSTK